MKVYSIQAQYDKYKSYVPENDELAAESFGSLRAKGENLDWPAILDIIADEDDSGMPEADIGLINIGSLVFTSEVRQKLGELALSVGQLLPMNYAGRELWLWNVTKIAAALDQDKSQINDYGGVANPVFLSSALQDVPAFKIREDNFTNIYCTDELKTLIEKEGFTGVEFEECEVV